MNADTFGQARRVFEAAMELPAPERDAFILRECGNSPELLAFVRGMLAAHDQADQGGFLAEPTSGGRTVQSPLTETPGTLIGRYKLLQKIGEGGFGAVFLAEQREPVARKVALKIIKLGMDTRQVIARFEAERQALALMDHPNIARVLDAGATDSGRPYFVMEYVKGDPIIAFADAHKLAIPDRLELFTQVCQAVQHAHTKGIIHRDLKPGNILVSMSDGKPFARVIDFGIAKATGAMGGRLTDKTLFTEHHQLIGTPEYMSPEQAEGSPDIDTRTDVYSLGVLLYELLTGATPFDPDRLRSAAFAEMQRIIKEEDPPSPSLRLTRDLKTLAAAAAARDAEPAKLNTLIKGELDWIVMKALDKDRARRYESPSQLAADVLRHLNNEAVIAAPPSAGYRVRKFVRRNKAKVVTCGAIALSLLAGAAVATWQWQKADAIATERLLEQEAAAVEANAITYRMLNLDIPWPHRPKSGSITRIESSDGVSVKIKKGRTPEEAVVVAEDASHREVPLGITESVDALSWVANIALDGLAASTRELRDTNEVLRKQTEDAQWSAYTANIALAQAALAARAYPEARRVLDQTNKTHRGWEFDFLARQAASIQVVLAGDLSHAWVEDKAVYGVESGTNHQRLIDRISGTEADQTSEDLGRARALSQAWWTDHRGPSIDSETIQRLHLITDINNPKWARYRFTPDHARIIETSSSRGVRLLNAVTGESTFTFADVGDYFYDDVALIDNRSFLVCWSQVGMGGSHDMRVTVVPLSEMGGPVRLIGQQDLALNISATLAACEQPPRSGPAITTINGARRIVGAADKTVRVYDTPSNRQASSEGPPREVAVFRMPAAVTNLQITGDDTRLIISLADGTARVWDIRDPAARQRELQKEWAERAPASEYLNALWNSPTPTDKLRQTIIDDASLSPLSRLVAVELNDERLADMNSVVTRAQEEATKGQTDKSAVLASAKAAALPPRAKALLIAAAEKWDYVAPTPTTEELLASETKRAELNDAALKFDRFQHGDIPSLQEQVTALTEVVRLRALHLPPTHEDVIQAKWSLGCVRFTTGADDAAAIDMMRETMSVYERALDQPTYLLVAMCNNLAGAELWCGHYDAAERIAPKLEEAWRKLGMVQVQVAIDGPPPTPLHMHYIGSVFVPWEGEPGWENGKSSLPRLRGDELRRAFLRNVSSKILYQLRLTTTDINANYGAFHVWLASNVSRANTARRGAALLEADRAVPESATAAAVARYQLGEYDKVISLLTGSTPNPVNLAYLAGAHHHLGHSNQATSTLADLRAFMSNPANAETWAKNPNAIVLLAEAEALIDPPKK